MNQASSSSKPEPFWMPIAKQYFLSNGLPALLEKAIAWAQNANDQEIHSLCGSLSCEAAECVRRAIAAVRRPVEPAT